MEIIKYLRDNYISIISLITAILSAYYAYRSHRISKRALIIAENEHMSKKPNFQLYLVENYRYIKDDIKILLFKISINNLSDHKNSFKAILEIEFAREDNSLARIQLDHKPNLVKGIKKNGLTSFDSDIRLEERSIETKWLAFEQPKDVFNRHKIESYKLKLTDVQGNEKQVESFIIKSFQL